MISGAGPYHWDIPLKFVHTSLHHLYIAHTIPQRQEMFFAAKEFFILDKKDVGNYVAKMDTKWVMLEKDASERKVKPAASSLSQAAVCCHKREIEREVWTCPFCSVARHIQCWNQSPGLSLCSHSTSPVWAAVAEVKSNLNSAMLQHRRTKALYQKLRDAANDGKLRPQAKFPQWSETQISSPDQAETHQLHLKSADRHFLFTDAGEDKSSLLPWCCACLYKALHPCN